MDFLQLAPDIDSDPDIFEAGFWGARVFELLLKVSARKDLRGVVTPQYQRTGWLAREWNLSPDDLFGHSPAEIIIKGVERLMAIGLLSKDEDCWLIRSWEKYYDPPVSSSDRGRAFRERQRLAAVAEAEARTAANETAFERTEPNGANETTFANDTQHNTTIHNSTETTFAGEPAGVDPEALELPGTRVQEPNVEDLRAAWNSETKPPLPRWEKTGKARKRLALGALRRRPLEEWREVFRRMSDSPLCRGETGSGWVADPDFALRPDGVKPEPAAKALEGAYDRRGTGQPVNTRFRVDQADYSVNRKDEHGHLTDF